MGKINGIVFLLALLLTIPSLAQVQEHKITRDSLTDMEKESRTLDVIDILHIITNYRFQKHKDTTGGKLHLAILPAVGYALVTGFVVAVAGTAGFYTDTSANEKLSAIDGSINYSEKNQIIIPLLSNIWTKKNTFNFLGDWRFYKFPEYTYGLGGHTSSKTKTQINYSCIIMHETVLKQILIPNFYVGVAYNLNYHWNISETLNSPGTKTDFDKYGRTASSISSGISVNVLYDTRKNSINPSQSFYSSVSFCPYLDLFWNKSNYRSLIIDTRKYFKLSKRSDNILAFWTYDWFTFNGNAPYLDLPSTGWDAYSNLGRGYIQSRLRSKNMLYLEAEYRFRILKNGLLGGVVFTNAQSVTDWPSNKFTTIYPAVGAGIRIKVNKHSATNIALDYAFGIGGSNGIFVNLGEVF